jgi:hypothetical protein
MKFMKHNYLEYSSKIFHFIFKSLSNVIVGSLFFCFCFPCPMKIVDGQHFNYYNSEIASIFHGKLLKRSRLKIARCSYNCRTIHMSQQWHACLGGKMKTANLSFAVSAACSRKNESS